MPNYDILIIGSGIVGATAALALAKNTSLQIGIIDSQTISANWQQEKYDFRVSAISLASQRILQNLNVWEKIRRKRVSPYSHMHVWQEMGDAKIEFDAGDVNAEVLGHIIEDSATRAGLYESFSSFDNIHLHHPIKLVSLREQPDCIELIAADNEVFTAKLIIAADGGNSWVRREANIKLKTHPYGHTAIVTTIKTELPHQSTAWQCFLATGPLAFLPLDDSHTSSIVWSTTQAFELLALDDEKFCEALTSSFQNKLGKVVSAEKRYHFPLTMRHAEQYVKSRIALIGDAAHTIHPLAGQGVNLGVMDAVCLADVIKKAVIKQRDFASFQTLRRYERFRKGNNLAMLKMVEMLKFLFMSDKKLIKNVRDFGLDFAHRTLVIKKFLTNYAIGNHTAPL